MKPKGPLVKCIGRAIASIAKSTLTTEMDNLQIHLHQEEREGLREQVSEAIVEFCTIYTV